MSTPLPNRQSIRLPDHDYSQSGYYFVTICIRNMDFWLGKIADAKMRLSDVGLIARQCWLEIPAHYPHVRLDEFVIMPNHIHGIIIIDNENVWAENFQPVRAQNSEPVHNKYQSIIPRSLGCIIRGFKIGVTKWCRQNGHPDFQWKKNYHDHIIRSTRSLDNIREYIQNNPLKWHLDKFNPENMERTDSLETLCSR
jgi:REP element-mobilizing transposase RayT